MMHTDTDTHTHTHTHIRNTSYFFTLSRSDMVNMKARTGVFKLNPLYEPSATSPQQKIKVSICSPKTKEKEMVSAILELARYGTYVNSTFIACVVLSA